jgi:hypothetical protein
MKSKQKNSQQVIQDNKILQTKKKKELGKTTEKTFGCMRPERVNKCLTPWQLHSNDDDDDDDGGDLCYINYFLSIL